MTHVVTTIARLSFIGETRSLEGKIGDRSSRSAVEGANFYPGYWSIGKLICFNIKAVLAYVLFYSILRCQVGLESLAS